MSIYVSTFCLASAGDAFGVLPKCARAGLRNIELGSRAFPESVLPSEISRFGFNFIAHNYFLQPSEPLIVNLASQNKKILKRSKEYIRRSIDFCHSLDIRLFTLHAGFRADPDIKLRFDREKGVTSYETAFDTFVESLKEVNDYAEQRGIRIAVENNVLSESNLVNGANLFLLLCEAGEFDKLWERIPSGNLGILLDLGHLKVTSRSLGFDRYKFTDRIKDKVFVIHVHENNERTDEHRGLDKTSWCFDIISQPRFTGLPVVVESLGLTINEILDQVRLIEEVLRESQVER